MTDHDGVARADVTFELYGDVILTRDVSERGLRAGDLETIVERHVVPGRNSEVLDDLLYRCTRHDPSERPSAATFCLNT